MKRFALFCLIPGLAAACATSPVALTDALDGWAPLRYRSGGRWQERSGRVHRRRAKMCVVC